MHHYHGEASAASIFGAVLAFGGWLNQEELLSLFGTLFAVSSAVVAFVLSQRSKIERSEIERKARERDEEREQRWEDFMLEWRMEQVKAGKLDPSIVCEDMANAAVTGNHTEE